ncbi:hypothetical protein SG34_024360 [Thalassomonas viridans]|uniref:Uncharacterized protein n=1 Tax=Thalassomonas viridans TaxID=137584 RepID=A0AAE9Z0L8_9GAMM|nr:hypothetical protein [Thalassomonas viridans]WDE04435.1 hypothetical protein SG34_024360 [Thalassomonas viridans]
MKNNPDDGIEQYVAKHAATRFSDAFNEKLMQKIVEEQKNTCLGISWPELTKGFKRIALPAAITCSLMGMSNVAMAQEGAGALDMLLGFTTLDVVSLAFGGF